MGTAVSVRTPGNSSQAPKIFGQRVLQPRQGDKSLPTLILPRYAQRRVFMKFGSRARTLARDDTRRSPFLGL